MEGAPIAAGQPSVRKRSYRMLRYLHRLPAYAMFAGGVILRSRSRFFGDRTASLNHVGFETDEKFLDSFASSLADLPPSIRRWTERHNLSWRAHIVTWAGNQALRVGGDFVECGVWFGILSKTMLNYLPIDQSGARFFLVDGWGGDFAAHPDYQDDVYPFVVNRFAAHDSVRLCRGKIPDALDQVSSERIAFLSIDLNGSVAERHALETLYDRIVPGGIIYFDDYGYEFPELRDTVDDFFSDKPERLLHFPTGQSLVLKI